MNKKQSEHSAAQLFTPGRMGNKKDRRETIPYTSDLSMHISTKQALGGICRARS